MSALASAGQFVAFQGVWFACVLGASQGLTWPGVAAGTLFVGVVVALSPRRAEELRRVLLACALGFLLDSALASLGVLRFAAPAPLLPEHLAPAWIVALWAAFATLVPRSLSWLEGRPWLAIGVGAVAGPVAYLSAARLGAAEVLCAPALGALAVGVEWGLATPLLVELGRTAAAADSPADEAPGNPASG